MSKALDTATAPTLGTSIPAGYEKRLMVAAGRASQELGAKIAEPAGRSSPWTPGSRRSPTARSTAATASRSAAPTCSSSSRSAARSARASPPTTR